MVGHDAFLRLGSLLVDGFPVCGGSDGRLLSLPQSWHEGRVKLLGFPRTRSL